MPGKYVLLFSGMENEPAVREYTLYGIRAAIAGKIDAAGDKSTYLPGIA